MSDGIELYPPASQQFSGTAYLQQVVYATVAALPASTYANGTAGVGATLTKNSNGALSIDGASPLVGDRVLIKDQAAALQNGLYIVTAAGGAGAPFVLTRAADFDAEAEMAGAVFVSAGTALQGTTWAVNTAPPITVGTTAIGFAQVAGPSAVIAGVGITVTGRTVGIDDAVVATDADLATHTADTTAVHGIADTAAVVLTGDARLSDARTPVSHAASHKNGGSDEVAVATAAANAIPKAAAGGKLDIGWIPTGATGTTVPLGNDARLSDTRTPTDLSVTTGKLADTAVTAAKITNATITDAQVAAANKDGVAGTASMRTLGTGAAQAAAGNDSRLSDSRAPNGAAGGDLAGSYPVPTLASIITAGGPVGDATHVPVITYDAKGRLTAVTSAALTGPTGAAGGTLGGTYPNPDLAAGVAGNGLALAANVLSVNVDGSTVELNADTIRVKALGLTDAHIAAANKDGTAGTASMRTLGTGATQATAGNDARLSDSRAPNGAAGGALGGTFPNPDLAAAVAGAGLGISSNVLSLNVDGATVEINADTLRVKALGITDAHVAAANKDGVAGTASMRTLGTGAAQATAGNDSRLSDARTPTAHATSHKSGGSDAVKLNELAAPTAAVALNAQKMTGVAEGTADTDAVTVSQLRRVVGIVAESGASHDLVAADGGKMIVCSNACAVNVPLNATTALPVGYQTDVLQSGTGAATVTPAGGVTIDTAARKTYGQGSVITLVKVATDEWALIGDLAIPTNPEIIMNRNGIIAGGVAASSFWVDATATRGAAGASAALAMFPLDPAFFSVGNLTKKCFVVASYGVNGTAMTGVTFTAGLYACGAFSGAASPNVAMAFGSLVTGSQPAAIVAPGAAAAATVVSADFDFPAAGQYGLAVVSSLATTPANSSIAFDVQLWWRAT